MPRVGLQPVAKTDEGLLSFIDINFRRLSDAIESLAEFMQGIQEVTGAVLIDTGMAQVENVIVSLADTPVAGACFVKGTVVGSSAPDQIRIDVYTSGFAVSETPINVAWFAIGE